MVVRRRRRLDHLDEHLDDLESLRGHKPDALFSDLTDTAAVLEVLLH